MAWFDLYHRFLILKSLVEQRIARFRKWILVIGGIDSAQRLVSAGSPSWTWRTCFIFFTESNLMSWQRRSISAMIRRWCLLGPNNFLLLGEKPKKRNLTWCFNYQTWKRAVLFYFVFSGRGESVIARESVRRRTTVIALDVRKRGGGGEGSSSSRRTTTSSSRRRRRQPQKRCRFRRRNRRSRSQKMEEKEEKEREWSFFLKSVRRSVGVGCFSAPRPRPQLQPLSSAAEANESNWKIRRRSSPNSCCSRCTRCCRLNTSIRLPDPGIVDLTKITRISYSKLT